MAITYRPKNSDILHPCTPLDFKHVFCFDFITHLSFSKEMRSYVQKTIERLFKEKKIPEEALSLGTSYATQLREAPIPPVSIQWINDIVQWGLFAETSFTTDQYIGKYTGIISENSSYRLNNYLYRYPIPDSIGRDLVIDAELKSNHCRFINHSFHPNLKNAYAFCDDFFHLILIASKPIAKGEQLTYNYGQNYWYVRGKPFIM